MKRRFGVNALRVLALMNIGRHPTKRGSSNNFLRGLYSVKLYRRISESSVPIEEMAPIARSGDFSPKLRTFSVVFSIDGNDARLMPDLSASVDVNPATQVGGVGAFP